MSIVCLTFWSHFILFLFLFSWCRWLLKKNWCYHHKFSYVAVLSNHWPSTSHFVMHFFYETLPSFLTTVCLHVFVSLCLVLLTWETERSSAAFGLELMDHWDMHIPLMLHTGDIGKGWFKRFKAISLLYTLCHFSIPVLTSGLYQQASKMLAPKMPIVRIPSDSEDYTVRSR